MLPSESECEDASAKRLDRFDPNHGPPYGFWVLGYRVVVSNKGTCS